MALTAESPLDLAALAAIPVTRLHGVGERKAKALAESEIQTVLDLITYYPRRYMDRTNQAQIDELMAGDEARVLVTVERCRPAGSRAAGCWSPPRWATAAAGCSSRSSTRRGGSASSSRA